jgi:RNA polymerase sigma factor (sigma-70 family)
VEQYTDSELVISARQGNKEAFGLLAERYQLMARRAAGRMIADEGTAQELVQEALLQAYLALSKLRDPARFKSWFYGIVLNTCKNCLRDQKITFFSLEAMAGGMNPDSFLYTAEAGPKEISEEHELQQSVMEAVKALAPTERAITFLFYYDQLSLQEIAGLQNISLSAVKVRLHRARMRLRAKILAQYPDLVPEKKRRKTMIRVKIADVVKQERKDAQGRLNTSYVMLLKDEAGRRVLPIWVGAFEGQSIAMELKEYPTPRPMTFNFCANLLKAIGARIEEVRIEQLKDNTYYANVKIICGQTASEIDARPSDAVALAIITGSPIFTTEDILKTTGIAIPSNKQFSPEHVGAGNILKEIAEWHNRAAKTMPGQKFSHEEIQQSYAELMASLFKT